MTTELNFNYNRNCPMHD